MQNNNIMSHNNIMSSDLEGLKVSGLNPVDTKSSSSSGGRNVGPDSSSEPAQIFNITFNFGVAAQWRPAKAQQLEQLEQLVLVTFDNYVPALHQSEATAQAAAEEEQLMMATAPTPLDTG